MGELKTQHNVLCSHLISRDLVNVSPVGLYNSSKASWKNFYLSERILFEAAMDKYITTYKHFHFLSHYNSTTIRPFGYDRAFPYTDLREGYYQLKARYDCSLISKGPLCLTKGDLRPTWTALEKDKKEAAIPTKKASEKDKAILSGPDQEEAFSEEENIFKMFLQRKFWEKNTHLEENLKLEFFGLVKPLVEGREELWLNDWWDELIGKICYVWGKKEQLRLQSNLHELLLKTREANQGPKRRWCGERGKDLFG